VGLKFSIYENYFDILCFINTHVYIEIKIISTQENNRNKAHGRLRDEGA
jgi:hypothetical protein